MSQTRTYTISGIDCQHCALKIEKEVAKMNGIHDSSINIVQGRFDITYDDTLASRIDQTVMSIVRKIEKRAQVIPREQSSAHKKKFLTTYIVPLRVFLSVAILIVTHFLVTNNSLSLILYIAAYLISGYDVLYKAVRNILKGEWFDEQFLMSIATVGAFFISQYAEATAVMAFYQVGEFFQSKAVNHSRNAITALFEMKVDYADVLHGKKVERFPVEQVKIGDHIIVKAGEKFPVDVKITKGSTSVDLRAVTGESKPIPVKEGDTVVSGAINNSSVIEAQALRIWEDSNVAKMMRMVEDAGKRKAKTESFITRFSHYYTPIVVFSALFVALVMPLITSTPYQTWIYRALVFLVVSCPCALVLSVPLGIFAAIGSLSKSKVLVKGGSFIESMSKVDTIVFDKTGTITDGELRVRTVNSFDTSRLTEKMVHYFSASLEQFANHVISRAIVSSYNFDLSPRVEQVTEYPGRGIEGYVDGRKVAVGNLSFMKELGINESPEMETLNDCDIFMSVDSVIAGSIILEDSIKSGAKQTVDELRRLHVHDISIVSGDSGHNVEKVASLCGIDTFSARKLPEQKLKIVEEKMAKKKKNSFVAFVGDGINDAPVLTVSDIGISMGMIGSQSAVESSDIVIMGDDLKKIPLAIRKSRHAMTIIKENIFLAISIKILVMILSLFGLSTLWMAVFADTGVALLAVANSLRILRKSDM